MKVTLKMTTSQVREPTPGRTEESIQDTGSMEKCTVKENSLGLMDNILKDSMKETRNMELVSLDGPMEGPTTEIGLTAKWMGREPTVNVEPMYNPEKVLGRKEKSLSGVTNNKILIKRSL